MTPVEPMPLPAPLAPEPGPPISIMPLSTGPTSLQALPAEVNITAYQGDDFTFRLAVFGPEGPVDLAGASVRAQIRTTPQADTVAGQFTPTVLGSLISLHLTSAVSAQLPAQTVWDCDITINGRVTTLAAGTLTLRPEVSR